MSDDDTDSAELRLAKKIRAEGEQLKQSAAADLEQARYERGQVEHARRLMEQTEKLITEREQRLLQLGEPQLVEREQAAEQKLAEAKALLAEFNTTKNEAYHAFIAIDRREREALAARQAKE
jgi:hypothetical protein